MYDAIVIGAGPAGLQAALTFGRMHRDVLVLDSGEYRNAGVAHMHHVIANDGTPPDRFRAVARDQLREYSTVQMRDAAAASVSAVDGGFRVALADGEEETSSRLLLATGLVDVLPDVPGLAGLWGRRAFMCPFCDGHEFTGRRVGILGAERAEHLVALLSAIGAELIVIPTGAAADAALAAGLREKGVPVLSGTVTAVTASGDGVHVETTNGPIEVDGLFVAEGTTRQRAPFADRLGLRMLPSGAIEIDEFGRTSLAGVSAAGDLAHRATLPGVVASVVMAAAAGQMAASALVQELATAS
ncbi:NAD(P)/FAD-dependent oxidoreductase [Microbacterium pseudoresistens]|uniref:Thioredoxin reductase n=1 Tax=Microbacterium pseudoresistens TaxID=640634 RepID=A0A7Y9EUX2_9MICO|nr:NAD(P)/FAD-dependent oxidoreductase [Microbacterium pseudoresistens]NYD53525.1 thioredoxin reductase [Microbacterium pseudoresistens]